jgi:hypothetical protein
MSGPGRSALEWVILGLLAALIATNVTFLILQRTGGPLIGSVFYLVLLGLTLHGQRRNHQTVLVGGLVGLVVHVVEVVTIGWSDYPMLIALNLVLPAALALSAWGADQRPQHVAGRE